MFKHSPGINISYYLVLLCAANVAADVRLCSIPYIPERECVLGPLYTCLGSQTHPSSLWRRCPCASFDPPSVPILEQASCCRFLSFIDLLLPWPPPLPPPQCGSTLPLYASAALAPPRGEDVVDLAHDLGLSRGVAPAPLDGIPHDRLPLVDGQGVGVLHGAVVLEDVAAEVGRVVAVDAEAHAAVEEQAHWQVFEPGDAAQPQVGQRAQAEQHALARQAVDDGRVAGGLDAVVDALGRQVVQRRGHVRRRALLARVHGAAHPQRLRLGEDA